MDIINNNSKARDFDLYGIPSIDTFGTGDYGQEARQAAIRNEAAQSVHEQLQEPQYDNTDNREYTNMWDAAMGTAEQMPGVGLLVQGIRSLVDPWRQANVQGHQVNLSKKQQELLTTEAKWVPEMDLAKQYLQNKQELLELNKTIEAGKNQWSPEQLGAAYSRQLELQNSIRQLEPELKNIARVNPYLQDIFYETKPGELFANDEHFGSITDLIKYYTYDYIADGYELDMNPGNNFKHMLAWDGINTIFGNISKLSQDQIDYMWGSKTKDDANSIATQLKLLDEQYKVADARKKQKEEDIQAKINTIKKGNLLFDPTKIDPEFKAKFENNQINLDDPMSWYYALPHLGSSYSEFGAMVGQMSASALMNYVAKGALAAGSGGTLPLLYALTEGGVNLAIAQYMRDSETKSEAFDAYQQRVLNSADELGINLPQIIGETEDQLSKLGYDVNNMSDLELFQASVAQQLTTSNEDYNKILQESKKGLEVLAETNSALSIPDYLESTLFSYGGNWLSKAYGLRKTLGKAASTLSQEMTQSISNKALVEAGSGIIDRTITRVADKIAKNPMGKVMVKDATSTLVKLGKAAGISYFSERTEEGIQNLVSSRYQKGMYDNVDNYSLLDGVANAANLGYEANLAYYGLHPDNALNTDQDLINEMKIGGFTGLFMTSVYGSRDVYQGTKQVLTDNKLRGLTADHYADAERDNKVEQFVNAAVLQKDGNFGRIRQSLESLKQYKPEGVTDEMIDEDIALANRVSYVVSNRQLNSLIADTAPKNSNTYKQVVKNAIRIQDRLNEQQTAAMASTEQLNKLQNDILADKTFDDNIRAWYNQYSGKDNVDFNSYKQIIMDNMLQLVEYDVLNKISDELDSREQDLNKLKEDLNLDVNVEGIHNIKKYIQDTIKNRKKGVNQLINKHKELGFVGTEEEALEDIKQQGLILPFMEELQQALTAKFVNDGSVQDLLEHANAYLIAGYWGEVESIKPTWNNLTEDQRQNILDTAAAEDAAIGSTRRPRTEKEVIEQYDKRINDSWAAEDELVDQNAVARRRALMVIQRDLLRRDEKEKQAKQEKLEENGTPADKPVVTTTEDGVTEPEVQATEIEEEVSAQDNLDVSEELPAQDDITESEDSEVQRLIDKLEQEENPDLDAVEQEVLDQDEIQDFVDDTETADDIDRVQTEVGNNNLEDVGEQQTLIEIQENSAEQVTESPDIQDEVEEQQQSGVQEVTEVKEEKEPEVERPTPSTNVKPKPVEEDEVVDNPTFEEGDASDVFIDPNTQQVMWDPTGQHDHNNAVPVDEAALTMQQVFDYQDQGLVGPSAFENQQADTDEKNPIVTKSKQKKAYISNTFFYQPNTDEVMPITVAGKDVEFITKDGKKAERRPGSQLAQKLATPGWLRSVDDAYYVVTSSIHQMSGQSAIDNLAVHLIIEKDGVVYNTSLRAISDELRKDLAALGMSVEEVDKQIAHLRALRTKIIKSYAPNYFADGKLPLQAAKHVKPTNLRISNGSLSNQVDENGLPKYRSLTEVEDFNIPSDPNELSDQVRSGEVEIGYGTGPFGVNPFEIIKLDQTDQTSVQGRGYAGKLFYIPKVQNTPSQSTTLPIMLAEELHRIPNAESPEQVQLSINVDGTRNRDENGELIPMTTAELIYEILVNGYFNADVREDILRILANSGKKTLMLGLNNMEKFNFNFLIRKQLHRYTDNQGNEFLITGALRDSSRPQLGYDTKFTNLKGITNNKKKKLVWEISQNIHWNTDKDMLMEPVPQSIINLILGVIKTNPKLATTDDTQIRIGTDDLTFSLRDIGYTLVDGKPVKKNTDTPLMVSWYINHKKIKTDLGDRAFYAPFVYADDIQIDNGAKPARTTAAEEVTSKGETITKETPKKPSVKKTKADPKNPTIAEPATKENLDKYGLQIPANQKLLPGFAWGIVDGKDGNKVVTMAPKKFVSGVFSVVKGTGTIDENQAKQWIVNTLGIDPSNVVVTNAVMTTMNDDKIYGVMRVASNAITRELMPQIVLSREAGEGVQYHEAFHYVSLLLLNDYQRNQIYNEYIKTHSGTDNLTRQEVEEALAEEFKHYMLNQNRTGLRYQIVKFFNNVANYVKALFGRPNLSRQLFKAIRRGDFKQYTPTEDVKREFYNKYSQGVHYYVPGLTAEQIKNMPNILDAETFYSVAGSLTSTTLSMYNIRSINDVYNLDIDGMFNTIQYQLDNGWVEEENIPLVQDVIANKDIFRKNILSKLNQLGIKEVDKQEVEEENRLEAETGDNPDNVWDKNQGQTSKKDNIAFRAKLFFYSVPKYEYVFNKDEQGVVTKELTPVMDNIFGLPVTESFNDVWNKIMENLWDIDSYEDIVNESARLGETDATFYSIHEMLTSEENPIDDNTKTQLETTIKSAKIQMNTINVKSDTPSITYNMSEEQKEYETAEALKRSIWEVLDSDNLRKIRRLPSRWSKAFFASNAVITDEDGKRHINPDVAKYIGTRRTKISSLITRAKTKRKEADFDGELLLQEMKDNFLQICNAIQIPFDALSLDYMLDNITDSNLTNVPQLNKFITFWSNKHQGFNSGILGDIQVLSMSKASAIKKRAGQGNARTLDRIFNYSSPDAQINMMAVAYGKVHPSPQEFSVVGADGALVYPISENNYMTDQIRNLNKNAHGKREQILSTPYSKRSLIANAKNTVFKLHNFLALNIGDSSRDYFDITPVEDYIAKLTLTFNNQMILPTMSDKKTWYSISGLTLVRDTLHSLEFNEDANYYAVTGQDLPEDFQTYIPTNRRFSNNTLNIFVNYWLDEFDAVFDYYVHKPYIEQNPTLRVDNYHGKIKNGKMDASGNGGRFRYFSSLRIGDRVINVNEDLANLEANSSNEEVMQYMQDLKALMIGDILSNQSSVYDAMNNLLVGATSRELAKLVDRGIVGINNKGKYYNKLVPHNIMQYYSRAMDSKMYVGNTSALNEDILYSVIGSHVANSALSIIEVEKCFTGDPAYYKWKKFKKDVTNDSGEVIASYDVISGRDVDKIKRLSAVLSTGTNLRTIWENPEENDTSISVLHLKDNEIGSSYYDQLHKIFRNSILRDLLSQRHPEYDDNTLVSSLDTEEKENTFYESLNDKQKKFVDDYAKSSAKPYGDGEINQSDAAVYVRPSLYRRIMKALGNWSPEIEEAYQIMEGDDESWLNDPVKYAKTTSALINPLKMVYFGDHKDNQLNLNIPVFDKMAMFPMFKVLAKADNRLLYDRMNNEKLGTIDMLTFESAVKVGGRKKFQAYEDTMNTKFNVENLNKPSYDKYKQEGNLPVFKQDISNLRLQLNTNPHEHLDRSFGTQAVKICLGNLIDNRVYGENKGQEVTGRQIKEQVMDAINRLTVRGANQVLSRFFYKGSLNNQALSDYLVSQAITSGMSDEVIDGFKLDADGNFRIPLAATSSRRWVESRLISYINKNVVDLNTPGGSAIQMSSFGFKATEKRKQSAIGYAFNDGKKLRFLNKDGSMDVMLSTNFFRHIVPQEHQGSYGQMRAWLLKNGIIGQDAKPMGVGYRIPTQGLSSTFSFKVVDVLPDRIGDTIIVPDEFTAMTGSDFDVDKLYLATLNYDENGNIIQYATDEEGNQLPVDKQDEKALQNRIIQSYQLVVSDNKNMAETRASIDTLTKMLQSDILPLIKPSVKEQALPMYELLPSFQLARKEEYTGGKAGIAPFALNSTNHCLTQLMHLNLNYSKGNPYHLGQIDEIRGRDGFRILDWLSAMINAHVDVAKDPYIMTLNVNQVTYNMTNLLLRGGMGKSTFYFLAQPVLKKFANAMIANKGVYGVESKTENQIIASLYKEYASRLKSAIQSIQDTDEMVKWGAIYNGIADELGLDKLSNNDSVTAFNRDDAFDDSKLMFSLQKSNENTIQSLYQQIVTLKAYNELSKDAKLLSELVHRSQIDTKKFGNTLSQHMNFRNSYETFINDNADRFSIRGMEFDEKNPQYALRTYFGQTFLSTKLHHATSLARKLLRTQTFPATKVFQDIFTSTMGIFGERKTIQYNNGSENLAYKHIGDKKVVDRFSQYIDSIIRARLSRNLPALHATDNELVEMLYGSNSMCKRLTGIKQYIIENKDQFPTLVNQDGTVKNALLNYLQEYPADGEVQKMDRIVLSDSSLNNDYDTENQLVSAFSELLESPEEVIRDFANDLAKYAYLTSYDDRGVNSFFNLVPNEWKLNNGYVDAIKNGLQQFKSSSNREAYSSIAEENDNPDALYFPSINIAIARNMWQDDDIVNPYKLNVEKGDKVLSKSVSNNSLKTDLFASSYTKGREFVKISTGKGAQSTTELYRMVGVTQYVNEEGEAISRGSKYIYQRIPKLGIYDNGVRIFEFQKDSLEESAFSDNDFDSSSILSGDTVEELALTALRAPKNSEYTIKFTAANPYTIKARIRSEAEIVSQDQDAPVMDNIVNAGEDLVTDPDAISEELMLQFQQADQFVYDTIVTENFDATEAITDVMQDIQEISDMQDVFAQASEISPIVTETEVQAEDMNQDMNALIELGKKRRKECE